MRVLIIITLIILILTVYFRYEKFQISSDNLVKFPFFKFTRYKKQIPNAELIRIKANIGYNKKFDNFFKGKYKKFILPGVFHRPIAGKSLLTRKFIPRPKISYNEDN